MAEYAIALALMVLLSIAGVRALGSGVSARFAQVANSLSNPAAPGAISTVPAPGTPTGLGAALTGANPMTWTNTWTATPTATYYDMSNSRIDGYLLGQINGVSAPATSQTWNATNPGTQVRFAIRACSLGGCSGYAILDATLPTTKATASIAAQAPTVWWPFTDDAVTGVELDASGHSNNGVVLNASGLGRPSGSIGVLNPPMQGFRAAGRLDGQWSSTYYDGTGASVMGPQLSTQTVSGATWLFLSSGSTHWGEILSVATAGGDTIALGVGTTTFDQTSPGLKLVLLTEGVCWLAAASAMTADVWHHVAFSNNNGTTSATVDGLVVISSTICGAQKTSGGVATTAGTAHVGTAFASRALHNGYVADAQFWNSFQPTSVFATENAAGRNP